LWIEEQLSLIPQGFKVLDAGAGELRNKNYCKHLHYISQDFCQYEGRGNGLALQTGSWDTTRIDIVSDIVSIPVDSDTFDVVLCTEVLEHLPDALSALVELARITKPGGLIILTAPFCSFTHFAPFHFSTGFSSYWYKKHLTDLGFTIEIMDANGGWFDFMAQEIYRLPWIGKTYSSRLLGWITFFFSLPLLLLIKLMKIKDIGSSGLVTFGWHVRAKKSR
jgi:ubiquinone/menaquinone biosynthesis C-methylase UbiE